MTSYKILLRKRTDKFLGPVQAVFTTHSQAEFALRKAIITEYGGLWITPVNNNMVFLDSQHGTLLGKIEAVEDLTTVAKVDAEFKRRMEEYRAANRS